jgi:hypothetical protein
MKKINIILFLAIILSFFVSCTKNETVTSSTSEPSLIIKFKFDPTQVRLNNFGQNAGIGIGNAALSPVFNTISSHYVELAQNANTQLGAGTILYHGAETNLGGATAIDFSKAKIVAQDEVFLKIPLKDILPGNYQWVRVSLSYQNYQIPILSNGIEQTGTLASFVGFNTYLNTFYLGNYTFPVSANKAQGYWAFGLNSINYSTSGQAPAGATTVPNPLNATSPISLNSCVVTGGFASALAITGNETRDVVVTLSLSINHSFEWHEVNPDGKFEPAAGENVVDMGLRGLIPSYQIQ